jgi:hypothetical protein
VTEHTRKARARRTLSRRERIAIAGALRDAAKFAGNDLTLQQMYALANDVERSTVIIERAGK